MPFRLLTFGQPALLGPSNEEGRRERVLGSGKPLALLAYCCTVRDREHSRDNLTALLWSDSDPTRARQNLRQTLWRLRTVIGDAFHANDEAALGITDAVSMDRDDFIAAIHRRDVPAALALYTGAFLQGTSIPGGDEFEEWAAGERRHLEEALIRIVTKEAKDLLAGGRAASARDTLDQLLKRTPDNVDAHRIALELSLQLTESANALTIADALERVSHVQERDTPAIVALIARARKTTPQSSHLLDTVSLDLVGREDVFSAIMSKWSHARTGTTIALSLTGAAGIGKTRLLTALAQRCQSKGAIAVSVKANQGERDVTFAFGAAIARALARKPGAGGVSSASARELVALDPSLGSFFATAASTAENSDSVRTKALAIVDLLGAVSEQQPLSLMLDDLHWSDAASRQMISIIVARAENMPLMLVMASRGHAQTIIDDSVFNYPLLPLRDDEMVDAIRSTGQWPDHDESEAFVAALATVCEGVPFAIVERLNLVRDEGLVAHHNGLWSSNDWSRAIAVVAVAAPVDQRIQTCSTHERRVLLVIAVAGIPQTEAHIRRVLEARKTSPETFAPLLSKDISPALAALEVRGLVTRMNDLWIPVHDVIAERLVELSTIEEREDIHRRLGDIASSGEPSTAAWAFRHYVVANEDDDAARQFRRVVKYQRSIGDSRSAREILQQISDHRLSDIRSRQYLDAVSLLSRQGKIRARWVVAPLVLACTLLTLLVIIQLRRPQLIVTQAPMTTFPANAFSARTLRTMPSIAISAGRANADDGIRRVHVTAVDNSTRIISGDTATIVNGFALFNTLRFESSERVVRLQFGTDGFAPTTLTVTNPITSDFRGLNESARLHLVGGVLNGRRISADTSPIEVKVGAPISGIVQAEYSTHWPTATVWLSMTPNWGQPRSAGTDVTPVMTPVQREVADVPVSVRAPNVPGHYWIIFVVDAEDSGGYVLSRTNWTVGHPIWGYGNEIARLRDDEIRRANVDGYINTQVVYLRDWDVRSTGCEPIAVEHEQPLKLCSRPTALFGIEIAVK